MYEPVIYNVHILLILLYIYSSIVLQDSEFRLKEFIYATHEQKYFCAYLYTICMCLDFRVNIFQINLSFFLPLTVFHVGSLQIETNLWVFAACM